MTWFGCGISLAKAKDRLAVADGGEALANSLLIVPSSMIHLDLRSEAQGAVSP